MADEYIGIPVSDLVEASQVTEADLLLLEQAGTPKKLTGKTLIACLAKMLDGHGGIKTIAKTGTSGLVDTYTVTLADGSASSFTVTNGAKGDPGAAGHVWIKYASQEPTEESHSMGDIPDEWIGICSSNVAAAPTDWTEYQWYNFKGKQGESVKGDPGPSGLSMYYTTEEKTTTDGGTVYFEYGYIESGGRDILVGDMLLVPNGNVYRVTKLGNLFVNATYVTSLKGKDGTTASGSYGMSIYRTTDAAVDANPNQIYPFMFDTLDTKGGTPAVYDLIVTPGRNIYMVVDVYGDTADAQYVGALRDPVVNPSKAAVGDTLVVKAVDSFGRPTEWEAVDPWVIYSPEGDAFRIRVRADGVLITESAS